MAQKFKYVNVSNQVLRLPTKGGGRMSLRPGEFQTDDYYNRFSRDPGQAASDTQQLVRLPLEADIHQFMAQMLQPTEPRAQSEVDGPCQTSCEAACMSMEEQGKLAEQVNSQLSDEERLQSEVERQAVAQSVESTRAKGGVVKPEEAKAAAEASAEVAKRDPRDQPTPLSAPGSHQTAAGIADMGNPRTMHYDPSTVQKEGQGQRSMVQGSGPQSAQKVHQTEGTATPGQGAQLTRTGGPAHEADREAWGNDTIDPSESATETEQAFPMNPAAANIRSGENVAELRDSGKEADSPEGRERKLQDQHSSSHGAGTMETKSSHATGTFQKEGYKPEPSKSEEERKKDEPQAQSAPDMPPPADLEQNVEKILTQHGLSKSDVTGEKSSYLVVKQGGKKRYISRKAPFPIFDDRLQAKTHAGDTGPG